MRKIRIAVVAALVMTVALMGGAVFADCGKVGCQYGGKKGDLESKFYSKAHLFMSNQEEIGLSDDQIAKIKELKMDVKKDMIKRNADIEILAIDIKSALYAETIDVNAVNALIDKKYELKKEKTKALVAAYAAIKEILTKEQKDKIKSLYKKGEKGR